MLTIAFEFSQDETIWHITSFEIVLLIFGGLLTLAVIGVFLIVFTRRDQLQDERAESERPDAQVPRDSSNSNES